MRRLLLLWLLRADVAYLKLLLREGWADAELASLRHHCQVLRVQLALNGGCHVAY